MALDVREVLRRIRSGETDRAVSRAMGVARKTVARYRGWATRERLMEGPLPTHLDLDLKLRGMVPECPLPRQPHKAAEFHGLIDDWLKKEVSPRAMFDRLKGDHKFTGSYSSVYRYVKTLKVETPQGFVRIEVNPGEEAQVDFGSAGEMVDPETGEVKRAWAFVMTLSFSRHQYVTFVFDQKVPTWLKCHRGAFEWFGGVPRKITLDNLKAAIIRAALHDPVVQRSYREFAEHYGFLISPCRPRTPRHKGKVESGVKYVKNNFLPGRSFRDITDAREQVWRWIETTAGQRIHGTMKERPLARFVVEKPALLPLPLAPYDMGVWKHAKLHPDCHIVVDGAYYSAPHRLIGHKLWARTNGHDVLIFHDFERIATHRWGKPGTRRTIEAHYPPEKIVHLMQTPQFCRKKAAAIGASTATVVEALFNDRPLDRLRSVQSILRLAEKFGAKRLEAASRRALCFNDPSHGTLKRILQKGLDNDPLPDLELPLFEKKTFTFRRPGSEIFFEQGGTDHGR
jgi:transposase